MLMGTFVPSFEVHVSRATSASANDTGVVMASAVFVTLPPWALYVYQAGASV
jgi:hypothetical protein